MSELKKTSQAMIKSNTLYDIMKHITQITLPAVGTLYFALSQIWGLPAGAEVVGSIVAVDAFLGVTLGVSTAQYNNSDTRYDGSVTVAEDDTKKTVSLDFKDAHSIDQQKEVRLKVNPPQNPS